MPEGLPPASLLAAMLWVIAVSVIGLMPRRFHKPLGLPMLGLLLPLAIWVAVDAGRWWAVALLAGGVSIFRYPLRRALGALGRGWTGRRRGR